MSLLVPTPKPGCELSRCTSVEDQLLAAVWFPLTCVCRTNANVCSSEILLLECALVNMYAVHTYRLSYGGQHVVWYISSGVQNICMAAICFEEHLQPDLQRLVLESA